MKSLITIFAIIFTFSISAGAATYSAEEIIRDIQSYQMTGKASAELSQQIKNIMRTEKVSREKAVELLKEFAEESLILKF